MDNYLPNLVDVPSEINLYYAMALNVLLGAGIAITLIGVLLAGIKYITSGGDPKAADKAKSALTYSVVGMILALGAYSIKVLVINTIGVDSSDVSNGVPGF